MLLCGYTQVEVLSYQRRVLALKREFMVRNKKTPLGIVGDYWDRSNALLNIIIYSDLY